METIHIRIIKGNEVLLSNPHDKEKPYSFSVNSLNPEEIVEKLNEIMEEKNLPVKAKTV